MIMIPSAIVDRAPSKRQMIYTQVCHTLCMVQVCQANVDLLRNSTSATDFSGMLQARPDKPSCQSCPGPGLNSNDY